MNELAEMTLQPSQTPLVFEYISPSSSMAV
jgi:hypothetical protein